LNKLITHTTTKKLVICNGDGIELEVFSEIEKVSKSKSKALF
jgi:hypothetical protein